MGIKIKIYAMILFYSKHIIIIQVQVASSAVKSEEEEECDGHGEQV